ncbi:uncharacterized protein LOC107044532 [Diachasma alloeum]|uniref:uncharacterized protein LOC107044532 n=1 Tax=Diachasma alloeum TaxID=454923 RepID=UPI00073832EB|nr:uncharacterized protein LOC107044532 [Diachasma alloeum]
MLNKLLRIIIIQECMFDRQADNGNVTVILPKGRYNEAVLKLLEDKNAYSELKRNKTLATERKTNDLVKSWVKGGYISDSLGKFLRCRNGACPRLYALPKIDKKDVLFRPIVSSIGSPTYALSSYIKKIISSGYRGSFSEVKNSFDFHDYLTKVTIPPDYTLVSLDVSSLYTNVPLDLVIKSMEKRKHKFDTKIEFQELTHVVKFIMSSTTFKVNDKFYKQECGLPMGSPLAPVLADMVMQDLEATCLDNLGFEVAFYKRYVDDIITAVPANSIQDVVRCFNSHHERLQFTFEEESNDSMPFLDLRLIRQGNSIITDWYKKPTWSGRYLNFKSHHPSSRKRGVVYMLGDRTVKLSHLTFRKKNLEPIKHTLLDNDYPEDFIEYYIKSRLRVLKERECNNGPVRAAIPEAPKLVLPFTDGITQQLRRAITSHSLGVACSNPNKLGSMLKPTNDPLVLEMNTNLVYRIPCGGCEGLYIGQMKKPLHIRIKEHKNNVNLSPSKFTALTKPASDPDHRFDYNRVKISGTEKQQYKRNILEMIHIMRESNSVNFRSDVDRLASVYSSLIK